MKTEFKIGDKVRVCGWPGAETWRGIICEVLDAGTVRCIWTRPNAGMIKLFESTSELVLDIEPMDVFWDIVCSK